MKIKKIVFFAISPLVLFTLIILNQRIKRSDVSIDFWLRTNFTKPYGLFVNTKSNFRSSLSFLKSKVFNNTDKNNNKDSEKDKFIDFQKTQISTNWHNLEKETIDATNFLTNNADKYTKGIAGGYLSFFDDNNLIAVNGIGELFKVNLINNEIKKISSNLNEIYNQQEFKGKVIKNLYGKFGVKDLFFDRQEKRILVSMTLENLPGSACYGMGILEAKIDSIESINKLEKLDFRTFFITKDCNSHFNGHATGGRIKRYGENIIYTIGDLDHNIYGDSKIPQRIDSAIGKVISINTSGDFKPLSMGHRNPQGLEIVGDKIFITEHGPTGGDEINLINPKNDLMHYGWPYYVYGFGYPNIDKFRYPHEGIYKKPIFYFSPSIATSEIVFYGKDYFKRWKNKFILASLKTKSIWILDYDFEQDRIMSKEQIPLGHRIRDIAISDSGILAITTDDQKILKIIRSDNDNLIESKKIPFP